MVPAPIPVLFRPGGREAEGARKEPFLNQGSHLRHVLGGGRLKARGAIAHDVAPEGAMGNL